MRLKYDLHIHSRLSLCADDDMTPNNIVNMCLLAGYDVIAVADHQSALNSPAVIKAGESAGLLVLPAMELCTSEEVHVLCLFETLEGALDFSAYVRERLFPIRKKPAIVWRQEIMDADDNVTGEESAYLGGACDIGIYDVKKLIAPYGGLPIPAHIDRPSHSLLSNLGFYDEYMGYELFEVSSATTIAEFKKKRPELSGKRFITDSDAHDLTTIADAVNELEAAERSAAAVIDALRSGAVSLTAL